ncbi:MAG: hypothetical protein J6Y55_04825 [Bacteroidales bacterium]|nr:hypothetical protein [Bacteroidales bacterium]
MWDVVYVADYKSVRADLQSDLTAAGLQIQQNSKIHCIAYCNFEEM